MNGTILSQLLVLGAGVLASFKHIPGSHPLRQSLYGQAGSFIVKIQYLRMSHSMYCMKRSQIPLWLRLARNLHVV